MDSTAEITVRNVKVEILHPVPFVLSSHLSFLSGQVSGLPIGVRIGIGQSLAIHEEDCGRNHELR